MSKRGILDIIDNTKDMMTAQVSGLSSEVVQDVEILGSYGFSGVPMPYDSSIDQGAVCAFGKTEYGTNVITAIDDPRFRPKNLEGGEVCVYTWNDKASPHRIILKTDGSIEINASGNKITITPTGNIDIVADLVNISGDLFVSGSIQATGDIVAGTKSLKTHKHGGVTTGGGQTGLPI